MDWSFIFSNTIVWLIAPETIAYAIATIGLAVHFGFGGLLNFGQAGFMALGAYGYAISILSFGLPWWVGIFVGLAASVVFALILGLPTLRLRADYLAFVTIAAAEVLRLLLNSTVFEKYTNAADGLGGYHTGFREANPLPPGTYGFGPFTFNEQGWWIRIFGLGILVIALVLVWLAMRSPWGRVVKGIREDEDAVRALGKNVFSYKLQILVFGGCLGSLGGVVLSLPSAVVPGVYLPSLTFFLWTILLLGGAVAVLGPVVGSVIFWLIMAFLTVFLPALSTAGYLPFLSTVQAGVLRYILVGVALMLIVAFRPQGILGTKKELTFNAR
ncbi:MAG: branched-chain amino acid ABC transporter permease [Microbacterium sp.]